MWRANGLVCRSNNFTLPRPAYASIYYVTYDLQ